MAAPNAQRRAGDGDQEGSGFARQTRCGYPSRNGSHAAAAAAAAAKDCDFI